MGGDAAVNGSIPVNFSAELVGLESEIVTRRTGIDAEFSVEPVELEAYITSRQRNIDADFIGAPTAHDVYHGEYTVIPTENTQTLLTSGLLMNENVTIGPIPVNYGKITWDGHTIRVS